MTGAGWIEKCDGDFNSHPHEEDDNVVSRNTSPTRHFNSHPHEEDDYSKSSFNWNIQYFNSHPHEEDDEWATTELPVIIEFQLTSSRRG